MLEQLDQTKRSQGATERSHALTITVGVQREDLDNYFLFSHRSRYLSIKRTVTQTSTRPPSPTSELFQWQCSPRGEQLPGESVQTKPMAVQSSGGTTALIFDSSLWSLDSAWREPAN